MTQEEVNLYLEEAQENMDKALDHLQRELAKITTGKASPALVSSLSVMYYGAPTPLSQVANVTTADARTIIIQPWERSTLAAIEKSIFEANIGITPMNDGEVVRLSIPPLTEERRRELVKRAKSLAEESKVGVRNARREAMEGIKKAVKDGFAEDLGKRLEDEVQDKTNKFIARIDQMIEAKEKDIMTV